MKNLLICICFLGPFLGYTQDCLVEGEFYNSVDIKTKGDVKLIQKKGKQQLVFSSSFQTEEGPDLDIYLSKSEIPLRMLI